MKESWTIPPEFRQQFIDACKEAATDDEAFKNFRKHDRINTVIENTPHWWADQALQAMDITPTMVRYQYCMHLINKLGLLNEFGCTSNIHVAEIGAGYGGQCKVLCDQFPHAVYEIYDLPEVSMLQKRWLMQFEIIPDFHTEIKPPFFASPYDLLISWCAWSELTPAMKKEYAEEVIQHAGKIFICANYNLQEDLTILGRFFPDLKVYNDDLVTNVIHN